jgi:hypothetical protein
MAKNVVELTKLLLKDSENSSFLALYGGNVVECAVNTEPKTVLLGLIAVMTVATSDDLKVVKKMLSKDLLEYVADGDLHTKLNSVEYSTNLREVVTVGYMMEQLQDN